MAEHSGKGAGYQLIIRYNAEQKLYYVSGFTMHMDNSNRMLMDRDGETLVFKSMQEVMDSIINYPDK